MTQVHNRLSWRERAALVLQHVEGYKGGRPKNFKREDIPKIRRMARKGLTREDIIRALSLDMTPDVFTKRCRELQINTHKGLRAYGDHE